MYRLYISTAAPAALPEWELTLSHADLEVIALTLWALFKTGAIRQARVTGANGHETRLRLTTKQLRADVTVHTLTETLRRALEEEL